MRAGAEQSDDDNPGCTENPSTENVRPESIFMWEEDSFLGEIISVEGMDKSLKKAFNYQYWMKIVKTTVEK